MRLAPDWSGRTVICIASGPSLTPEDCERVRAAGHPTIVCNTTFRLCLWADVLVGFDLKWWKLYGEEARHVFAGRRIAASQQATKYGAEGPYGRDGAPWFSIYGNTGACAASIGLAGRPARVVLLGYDASFDNDRKHWHADHPAALGNADSVARWPYQFGALAKNARRKGIPILNASRRTLLTCFPRVELEEVL